MFAPMKTGHTTHSFDPEPLRQVFGERLQAGAPLARYTAARIGGPADWLLAVDSAAELAQAARLLWGMGAAFTLLGGGSNVLVGDGGLRGVVILNRARRVRFEPDTHPPEVWAESGANLGRVARQAAQRGLSGLEWAAGIPGTIGGAVFGNAGAHGGDMGGTLLLAEILQPDLMEEWPVERLGCEYRSSLLKRRSAPAVVLSARLRLQRSYPQKVLARLEELSAQRRRTQPPGASMGSMFKNPPGDYAGRLIEAAGLKGARIGGAEISQLHANFFTNLGEATAADVNGLIELARQTVFERFGVRLELEIERLGE